MSSRNLIIVARRRRASSRVAVLAPLLWALFLVLGAGRAFAASGPRAADAEPVVCESGDLSSAEGSKADSSGGDGATCEDSVFAGEAAELGETVDVADPSPSEAAARGAPLCDNGAVSIAAVAEVPEVDRGRIEPAPCDVERLLALLRSDDRRGSANVIAGGDGERPERQPTRVRANRLDAACTSGLRWPPLAASSLMASARPRGLGWRPGYPTRVERPPSTR